MQEPLPNFARLALGLMAQRVVDTQNKPNRAERRAAKARARRRKTAGDTRQRRK